jgi:tRNA dimethylallyltransferase
MELNGYNFIPIICGPTASGKSSLALELCEMTGGELISCDSMQIYKHLDIGTAKASPEEQQRVHHHMTDIVEPGEIFSVNDYIHRCYDCIEDILSKGKLPVICGGTGQYISALKDGIRYVDEPIPSEVVDELSIRYDNEGADKIYSELLAVDPIAAEGMHMNNKRRVIRALAVYKATGKTFTQWNSESKKTGPKYPYKLFEPDYEDHRDILYERINKRVDVMMDRGLLKEAEYLYSLPVDHKSTCFQAIGYKEFKDYISEPTPENLERAVYLIKLNSRHYAKRQLTWFRYISEIIKIDPFLPQSESINDTILQQIRL